MQALFSLGVTVVAMTSVMLFYVFDKSMDHEKTPVIRDQVFNKEADSSEDFDVNRDSRPSGFRMDAQEKQTESTSQVKLKKEAKRLQKAKEAEAAALAKKKEAERQKKVKEAEAAALAKKKEEAKRQKKAKEAEAAAQAKKEEAERQKKAKEAEAAALAKKKEEAERQKKVKEAEAAAQAKKEEAERQKKAKEAEAAALAKKKEEAERRKKVKEAEAAAQAKKEEAERQKKVKEAEAAALAKKKEEAERQKKAKEAEAAAMAKKKEEAEHQKKVKEAEAAAQAKKEEAERQKKAKDAEAEALAKKKEEAERQKKAKEAEAVALAKKKEEADHQKKAKEAEAAAMAKKKEEAERQMKVKEAEAAAQAKKEEAKHQKKANEAAALAKKKEEAERQKKAKEAEAVALAKKKEEADRQKKAKEAEAAAMAKKKEEAERQMKVKEAEAAAQAKKEEAKHQKKANEAAALAKKKEEAERQKKAKDAEALAKKKEEAERQKKAKEAEALAKKKEEAERQKKAKEGEAAALAKKKEEAERQKKAKEAEALAKKREEAERQKKAKEGEAAALAKKKEEAERQKKVKEAEALAKKKEEAEHQKKAKEAEAAALAKKKEEAERQKKAKNAEAAALAKKKEEAERQKKAKEAEAAALAKKKEEAKHQSVEVEVMDKDETVHLAVVACGDRLEEPLVMIKSAILLTQANLHVHIFADDGLRPQFKSQLETWPTWVLEKFTYKLYEIQFPEGEDVEQWKKLFKLCASQRLFLPYILKDLSGVLYVDTDILFMRPIENIWQFFKRFNTTQIAALTAEHESPNAGWYNRFARHPYYGKLDWNQLALSMVNVVLIYIHLSASAITVFDRISILDPFDRIPQSISSLQGVNSGVMLMNLTRMREAKWKEHILPYYKEYKLKITWGDQDLINIFFHYYPEKLYVYTCNWNFRPDHCMYGSDCKPAEEKGVSILHGNRGTYHNEKQPAFRAIYEAVRDFQFGDDLEVKLLGEMKKRFKSAEGSYCATLPNVFFSQLERQIKLLKEKSTTKPVSGKDVTETKQAAASKDEMKKETEKEQDVAGASKDKTAVKKNKKEALPTENPKPPIMHLAVVACGNRFAETLVLLKSAVLLTRAKIVFHIFADDNLQLQFKQKLSEWPENVLRQVTYKIRPIQFPSENEAAWKKLFKPCASQRLFLANILEDVDALLYVDTDVLFFTPLEDIWVHFDAFNSTQIAALAGEMEHTDTTNSWYKNFAKHPYYPPLGVNSGVMLMNLTRMRQVDWLRHIVPYHEEYKHRITWGDQDLINIYFHHFPERLYMYSCKWNYRHDHCIYGDVCRAVRETGVSVLHGCRRIFQNDKEPAYRAIYLAMEEYKFGDDLGELLKSMKTRYKTAAHTSCGQMERHFFQQLERHIAARKHDKA